MISIATSLKHYKQKDVQEAIVAAAHNKEIAVLFGERGFGKRPDVLAYPKDVLEFAKQGATSFHCSEELWSNPLQVTTGMPRQELDNLRAGWDLILDIDCPFLEYSAVASHVIVQALQHHGIRSLGVKFSGNHGFHIGIPAQAFPEKVHEKLTKNLFPEGPRTIAAYLRDFTRQALAAGLLLREDITTICAKTGKKFEELVTNNIFDPYKIVSIDTVLISSRHLYRMPYSLNEKSGLVSIPILPEHILAFNKETAKPESVKVNLGFFDEKKTARGEAKQLIVQAFDYKPNIQANEKRETSFELLDVTEAVPEDYFPPCMKNILKGLHDGRKRSLFVLVNFLTSIGWDYDRIEAFLNAWNQRNQEPLREVFITGQIRYHKQQRKKILPPNCFNKPYYMELGFCQPDNFCARIKNPVNYAILKQKITARDKKSSK